MASVVAIPLGYGASMSPSPSLSYRNVTVTFSKPISSGSWTPSPSVSIHTRSPIAPALVPLFTSLLGAQL